MAQIGLACQRHESECRMGGGRPTTNDNLPYSDVLDK